MASRKALSPETVTTALAAVNDKIVEELADSPNVDSLAPLYDARRELSVLAAKNGIAKVNGSAAKPTRGTTTSGNTARARVSGTTSGGATTIPPHTDPQ